MGNCDSLLVRIISDAYFMIALNVFFWISGCWDDSYEFHSWANVICVRHVDPWYDVLRQLRVNVATAEAALKAAGKNV